MDALDEPITFLGIDSDAGRPANPTYFASSLILMGDWCGSMIRHRTKRNDGNRARLDLSRAD